MSNRNDDFQALMQRVLDGSDEAAKELFDNYAPCLVHAIRRRLSQRMRSRFDTQDFAQDVWASFFAEAPDKRAFDTPDALLAFLTVLAQNKISDAARQRTHAQKCDVNRELSLDDSQGVVDKGRLMGNDATPSQILMGQEEWLEFFHKQRPVYQRVLILLRAGKTHEQIAREMKVDRRTVDRIVGRLAREMIHGSR